MWLLTYHLKFCVVALRKESVDRNTNSRLASLFDLPSLSARRAWIEMLASRLADMSNAVALRKESVDRNHVMMLISTVRLRRSPQGERG